MLDTLQKKGVTGLFISHLWPRKTYLPNQDESSECPIFLDFSENGYPKIGVIIIFPHFMVIWVCLKMLCA
jgi:hypothetical protein